MRRVPRSQHEGLAEMILPVFNSILIGSRGFLGQFHDLLAVNSISPEALAIALLAVVAADVVYYSFFAQGFPVSVLLKCLCLIPHKTDHQQIEQAPTGSN